MRSLTKNIQIKKILYIHKLQVNLLSVSKILFDVLKVEFNIDECIVRGTYYNGTT